MNTYRRARPNNLFSAIALAALMLCTPLAFAHSEAISTMAGIAGEINHYPSAEHKEALMAISEGDSNSEATKAIAAAIHNMEHQVKPEDKAALEEIIASSSTTEHEKELAEIVMGINHQASPEAQKKLEEMTQPH